MASTEQEKLVTHLERVAVQRVSNHSKLWELAVKVAREVSRARASHPGVLDYDEIVAAEDELKQKLAPLMCSFA